MRWWSVGYLAPRLIALAVAVDLVLRVVPSGWVGLELLGAAAYRLPGEAFARNYRAQGQSGGDLSALANLPSRRIARARSVTTDAIGFRNPAGMSGAGGIVVGDSFGNAGSSSRADLAGQLSIATGCRVFNAASEQPEIQVPDVGRVLDLAQHLEMRGGLVVAERLERLGPPRIPDEAGPRPVLGRAPSLFDRARVWATVSPARLGAETALKRLYDDRILPNVYRSAAVERRVSNGDWMLFYDDEMRSYDTLRTVSIDYWKELAAGLSVASLRMLVVLVPNKYTVYYRHLSDAAPTLLAPEEYLTATEIALRRAGIPVVNLTGALQREATTALGRGEYLYHRDDTHWNDRGLAVAAREIARVWREAGGPACP